MSLDLIPGDRRLERRYSFESPLKFSYTHNSGNALEGWGQTEDLGRTAIRFRSETLPPVGTNVEATIAWPFLLQGVCRLELIVRGPVCQVSDRGVVMQIRSHEFRTCGERSFVETAASPGMFRVA
jgi:hypothetical protein